MTELFLMVGLVAEWLAWWTQVQKARVQIAVATLSSNSLRQTVHTHYASVRQAAKLVAALLRVAGVTAGLVESNGGLPPGLWLTPSAGWLPRTGISSGTLRSVIEYGLPLPFLVKKHIFGTQCRTVGALLSLFVLCEHSHWKACDLQFANCSRVQLMCYEENFTRTQNACRPTSRIHTVLIPAAATENNGQYDEDNGNDD